MLNEAVKRVLKESMWDLATCAGNEPNVVPVAFKDVTEAGLGWSWEMSSLRRH